MYRGQETGDSRRQSNEKSEARAFGGVGVIENAEGR
jgi:hypothetical protein